MSHIVSTAKFSVKSTIRLKCFVFPQKSLDGVDRVQFQCFDGLQTSADMMLTWGMVPLESRAAETFAAALYPRPDARTMHSQVRLKSTIGMYL